MPEQYIKDIRNMENGLKHRFQAVFDCVKQTINKRYKILRVVEKTFPLIQRRSRKSLSESLVKRLFENNISISCEQGQNVLISLRRSEDPPDGSL